MHSATFADIKDRSVVITGGASGIGAGLVEGFAAQGARVAFVDILDGNEAADRIGAATGNRPVPYQCDLTDIDALKATFAQIAADQGPILTLVNNAAQDDRHATLEVTTEYWHKALALNLDHQFFAAQAVLPGMKEAGGGTIVNFSSISFMLGMGGLPAYTAAKSAIIALTRGLAREFGADNIRVNSVAPGWIMTERQLKLWATPETMVMIKNQQSLKRHLQPADLVGPVLFLSSDVSGAVTGQCMIVDGGWING